MPAIGELEDKKADVHNRLKNLNKTREEKGEWDEGQVTEINNLMTEYTDLQGQIETERAKLESQAKLAADAQKLISNAKPGTKPGDDGASGTAGLSPEVIQAIAQQFGSNMPHFGGQTQSPNVPTFRCGAPGQYEPIDSETIMHDGKMISCKTLNSDKYRKAWRDTVKNVQGHDVFVTRLHEVWNECNDDGCGTTMGPSDFATGGFMLNPMMFASELQKCCDKSVVMRSIANVVTVTSIGISIPRLTKRLASFAKGCECEPPAKCDIPEGDRIEFRPQPWTQCTGICDALLKFTMMNPERLLMDELTRDLRENLEFLYLYDDGQAGPLGILHPNGLSTDPVLTPDSGLTPDKLIDAMCALPNCASNRAQWLFSNTAWCQILKLKDGNDNFYFWQTLLSQGVGEGTSRPALFGHPVNISETIVGDFETDGTFPGVFGDFSSFLILDGPATDTKKDTNIFSNRTCWVVRGYTGGGVVNDCDFVRFLVEAA